MLFSVFVIRPYICWSGPSTDYDFTVASSHFVSAPFSGSSHGGGGALQAPRQTPQSPADVTHLALPDMGVEDVLELQLQQLTLAQFTVVTMEHAIPLLRTGRSHCSRSKEDRKENMFYHLLFCFLCGADEM